MKFKIYFLLALLWAAPALAMKQELTAENIVTHPRFLELKQAFEEINGDITVFPDRISPGCHEKGGSLAWSIRISIQLNKSNLFQELEEFYFACCELHDHYELNKTMRSSLQGLCILEFAEQCREGNQETITVVASLSEELKSKINLLIKHGILNV